MCDCQLTITDNRIEQEVGCGYALTVTLAFVERLPSLTSSINLSSLPQKKQDEQ